MNIDRTRKHSAIPFLKKCEDFFRCDFSNCNHYASEDPRNKMTAADYLHSYSYIIDDDKFNVPHHYETQKIIEECVLFNHSCDSNVEYGSQPSNIILLLFVTLNQEKR